MADEEDEVEIANVMKRVHRLLCVCFGVPPEQFAWTYEATNEESGESNVHTETKMTPLELLARSEVDLSTFVVLVNIPASTHIPEMDQKRFGESYTVDYLQSVAGGATPVYHNVDVDTITRAAMQPFVCAI